MRMSSAIVESSSNCLSRIDRPSIMSPLLSRPPNRRASPPIRIAALGMRLRSYSYWPWCPPSGGPPVRLKPDATYGDMRDAGVGRVLVASLHEAIGDILPARLAFYEN